MISREELYKLVWSEPMTKVAKRFEVSSSYLARVCTLLNVSRPARGYWAKLAVGKAPNIVPLPDARPGDQLYWSKNELVRPPSKPRQVPKRRPNAQQVRIPRSHIHHLLRGAKEHFEKSRPIEEGTYLKPYKRLLVDVTASRPCLDNAIDLANDLFHAFESVGHRVVIAPRDEPLRRAEFDEREVRKQTLEQHYRRGLWSPNRPTVVYIGSMAIGLAVVEMSEEVLLRYVRGKYIRDADYKPPKPVRGFSEHTWTTTRELPSGRLRVVAYSPYWRAPWATDWQETKNAALRPRFKSIVETAEASAIELVERLQEADRKAEIERVKWRAAEERRKREEDRRCVEQSFLASRRHLDEIIQQWAGLMNVERFLAGVEKKVAELPEGEQGPVLERLKLAREFLGTRDPLDFFRAWKTPDERYRPIYSEERAKEPD